MKSKIKPKRNLSMKQRRFIKEYIRTGNATQAASKAYNTKNDVVAQNIGSENLCKPMIKSAVIKAQEELGITDKFLARSLKEGLKAKEIKFFADAGKVKDKRDCIDYSTRAKYLEIGHKLRGDFIDRAEVNATVSVRDTLQNLVRERIKQMRVNKTNE